MYKIHQLQHRRIIMMASAALVFGYFAIWQLFASLFDMGSLSQWDYMSKEFYLLVCCVLMITSIITIMIRSELDNRQVTKAELYDQSTGLPNGIFLKDRIKALLKGARQDNGVGLMIVGIGGLDSINETWGYSVGNQVIEAVAKRLETQLDSNIILTRVTGDRFGLLFSRMNDRHQLRKCADKIIQSAKTPLMAAGTKSYVDFSIGAVFSADRGTDADEFSRQAELALLHCKTSHDAEYAEFSDELAVSVKRLSSLETGLREALETGQIDLHYQPLISSDMKTIVGVEALARWKHPSIGQIPPHEFVTIAEALGLTAKLGNVVLREACRAIKPILGLKLAVNISPNHFLHPDFLKDVDHILQLTGFDPKRLEIEITESVLLGLTDSAKIIVNKLQSSGISVALDDFGTGYSSLSYLNLFNVDRIKIDAEFIKEVGNSEDAKSMFASIFNLINSRGFDITVEGVENIEQIKFLSKFKNFWYQGFLFSKPLPYIDLIKSDLLQYKQEATNLKLLPKDKTSTPQVNFTK